MSELVGHRAITYVGTNSSSRLITYVHTKLGQFPKLLEQTKSVFSRQLNIWGFRKFEPWGK